MKELGHVSNFREVTSKGIQGEIDAVKIVLGSASFVGVAENNGLDTVIHVSIDQDIKGKFSLLTGL